MSKLEVTLEGFLSRDPELKTTRNGKDFVSLKVPHQKQKRDGNQWVDDGPTVWVEVTVWDAAAQSFVQQLRKGDLVRVSGPLEVSAWTRNKGKEDESVEVNVRVPFGAVALVRRKSQTSGRGEEWTDEPPF